MEFLYPLLLAFVGIIIILLFYLRFSKHSKAEFKNRLKNYYHKHPRRVILIIAAIILVLFLSNMYKPDWLVLTLSGLNYP